MSVIMSTGLIPSGQTVVHAVQVVHDHSESAWITCPVQRGQFAVVVRAASGQRPFRGEIVEMVAEVLNDTSGG